MNTDRVNFRKLFRDIGMHVDVGLKLYRAKRTEDDAIFLSIFEKLDSTLRLTQEHLEYLSANVAKYDFVGTDGHAVKGNGYRSVLHFAACILEPLHESLLKAAKSRSSFRFSASEHINSLYLHCNALQGLERLTGNSRVLMEATPAPQLFNVGEVKWKLVRASIVDYLSRDIFYGRLFAIHYPSSIKSVLKMLGVGMASYEQWYHGEKDEKSKQVKQILSSLWKGSHYLKSPTRLGLKLDDLTNDCSVHFVKAFWSLADQTSFQSAMRMLSQSVKIRHHLEVPSKDLKVPTVGGGEVEIKPSSVHLGYKPISLLLLSNKWRGSQPCGYATKKQPAPLSPGLVVHIHGGGYVAQSPQSHESYLRHWAVELDVPVVSIDYSLSPEAPYPRALEECVMAYGWILQNFELLGTTGEHIMLVGDSAGGNFAMTTAMKLKQLDVRLPDGILMVYPSTDVRTSACPSRVMSLVDPILPLGVMVACQQAYSNTLPVSEELSLRREYRRRIMRAQGYYLPDPDTKSPSWKRKRSTRERSKSASVSKTPSQNTDREMASMTEKPKVAPERPPPPSFSKPRLQAASNSDSGASNGDGGDFSTPPLEAMMEEVSLTEDMKEDREDSLYHSKIPVCFQQEPEQRDVLSPSEFEELVEEVVRAFQDGDVTKDPFMSPALATDDLLSGLPPVHIIGAGLDSLLDDAVAMAQRLKMAGQPVTLDVLDGLFHGFLVFNVAGKNTEINHANKLCLDYIKAGLNIDFQNTKK